MAEILVGLLQRDPNSYLYLDPSWKPAPPIATTTGKFDIRRPAEIRRCCLIARATRREGLGSVGRPHCGSGLILAPHCRELLRPERGPVRQTPTSPAPNAGQTSAIEHS